jgi:hypothetical protein
LAPTQTSRTQSLPQKVSIKVHATSFQPDATQFYVVENHNEEFKKKFVCSASPINPSRFGYDPVVPALGLRLKKATVGSTCPPVILTSNQHLPRPVDERRSKANFVTFRQIRKKQEQKFFNID